MKISLEIIRIGAFLILTFLCIGLHADQSVPVPTSPVELLIQKAHANKDSAAYYFEEAYQKAVNDQDRIRVNRLWAEHYLSLNQKDSARQRLCLNLINRFPEGNYQQSPELARAYVLFDRLSEDTDVSKEQIAHLRKAYEILEQAAPNDIYLSWAYLRLGICLWYSEFYGEAEQWWEKAYQHAKKNRHIPVEIKAFHHLGFIYTKERKLSLSQSHYRYLLSLIEKTSSPDPEDQLLALNALGNAFSLNDDFDSALVYFRKGLEIVKYEAPRTAFKKDLLLSQALIHHNMGSVFRQLGEFRKSAFYLNSAIETNRLFYGDSSPELIRSLRHLGEVYQALARDKESLQAHLKALEISKKNDYDQPGSYTRTGDHYRRAGQYDLAITYYDSALESSGSFLAIKSDQYIYTVSMSNATIGKTLAISSMEKPDSDTLEKLYASFKRTLTFLHNRIDSKHVRNWIPVNLEGLYIAYAKVYEQTLEEQWLERLWEIIELNKAVKLRHQLTSNDSLKYAIPQELLDTEKLLKEKLAKTLEQSKTANSDSLLFFINRDYETLLAKLEQDFPKYYALKNKLKVVSLETAKLNLKEKTLLLNFLEGQQYIHLLKLSESGVSTLSLLKSEIEESIDKHNYAVLEQSQSGVKSESCEIRNYLKLNLEDLTGIDHLHIIPDGIIWNLNFASALNYCNENASITNSRYTFSYHYFAGEELHQRKKTQEDVLAFSFSQSTAPSEGSRGSVDELTDAPIPGTSAEIKSISQIWEGKYYFAQNANETRFKAEGDEYSILHLAVHGFLDETSPENSYLKFASADSLNDGKLHVYEIYNLKLNADLAVLSACHSGQGKIVTGEGMMSMGRAFAYAGVRSLLISRWEVSDYSAPHLMKYFYQGLKEGMYKSEALKYAQTQYLENHSDALTSSPFYWSSFYVLGDDDPIYKTATLSPWVIWTLLAILLSLGVFYRRKKIRTTL